MEIIRGMYGLSQAGFLAEKLLKQRLDKHSYYQVKNNPGLWNHVWRTISFKLVVDEFEIGYVGREHADHLMSALKMYY